jgi:hypothetical protein
MRSWFFLLDSARPGAEVSAWLSFRKADPFAVELEISVDGDEVSFVFARELLIDGLAELVGEPGFVQIGPHDLDAYITFTLPVASARREFYAERFVIDFFVDMTCRKVPLSEQRRVAAAELNRWLAGVTS